MRSEMCASRESLRRQHIIGVRIKNTHGVRRGKKDEPRRREFHMPGNWIRHHCKCSKETGPANRSSGSWNHITPRRPRKYTNAGLDRWVNGTEVDRRRGIKEIRGRKSYKRFHLVIQSSGEDLHHTVPAATDDPASVTTPYDGADTFTAH